MEKEGKELRDNRGRDIINKKKEGGSFKVSKEKEAEESKQSPRANLQLKPSRSVLWDGQSVRDALHNRREKKKTDTRYRRSLLLVLL